MFTWRSLPRRPLIIAHRGSSAVAPENTLAAFSQAIADCADGIEIDVRLSRDNEVIVIHDGRLERTTNGRGRVKDSSLRELKKLSAGTWFHKKFSSEKIPTLAEVFELVRGAVGINIEIKTEHGRAQRKEILTRCMEVVRQHRASEYVLISSFHHPFVQQAKILDSKITTGVLYHPVHHLRRSPGALTAHSHADFFICNKYSLHKRTVQKLRERGIRVGVYVINTKKAFEKFAEMKVDCVYTDNPAALTTPSRL